MILYTFNNQISLHFKIKTTEIVHCCIRSLLAYTRVKTITDEFVLLCTFKTQRNQEYVIKIGG
jgi:hypothetical protein